MQRNYVFVSYLRENSDTVVRLCDELRSHGIEVWIDRDQIAPGKRWKQEIRNAIRSGSFFIACFSTQYSQRDSTYMNEELTFAIEELRQRHSDISWFIPVKLSACDIPNRDIGAGETLRDLHWVELYGDWTDGVRRIVSAMNPGRTGGCATSESVILQTELPCAAEVQRLSSQKGSIASLAPLPQPGRVLSLLQHHDMEMWDLDQGRRIRYYNNDVRYPDNLWLEDFSLSFDGRFAASCWDDMCHVWDLDTGRCVTCFPHNHQAFSAIVLPGGERLLSIGDEEEIVRVWDLHTDTCVNVLRVAEGCKSFLDKMVLLPDQKTILFGSWDNAIVLWDLASGASLGRLEGHSGAVTAFAVDSLGKVAISGSSDDTVRLWDLSILRCVATFEGHANRILSIDISADAVLAASLDEDGMLKLWHLSGKECLRSAHITSPVVRFTQDGEHILVAVDNDLIVYSIRS